jgi:predicted kinase
MKLIVMVGIPGSGKSYNAEQIARKENATIVASDQVRKQLYGDESIQGKPQDVFNVVYKTVDKLLSEGKSVILDATNIKRKKRINLLKKYKDVYKECYYVNTPLELCIKRDEGRKKKVGEEVITRFYKQLEIPLAGEGFDKVNIIHNKLEYPIDKESFVNLISKCPSYEELFDTLKDVKIFADVYGLNQENPYHKHMLCEHIYNTYQYINEFYDEEDKLLLQVVALLHDIGKPICKRYREVKGYHTYYGHEFVSSQIACHFLKELGFDDKFVMDAVSLIQLHMFIHFGGPDASSKIYHWIGEDLLSKLYIFKDADTFGK